MPTGKVRFYDADKGFGFISEDSGADVFLHANALPEGITTLKKGVRVEFGIVEGRKGAQALSVKVLDPVQSVAANKTAQTRKTQEELTVIIEDVVQLLDGVGNGYRAGRRPDRKLASNVARALRGLADELEK
ncbi:MULTISPECIES: cold-shock protein [unclassified Terrabacter]|uniref:cold-shock protein n=1 Tax=unclassified Terrabacter TaxID=2630222 RepID=UPI000700700C|nr:MULTISPECIES: cold-shock protein [unclassified Terrabacter]KRB43636.1 cold-shock protein [Terrabacter sp. Root181]KRF47010.1 cold-shock protein [Terrabacter sp. Soil810]